MGHKRITTDRMRLRKGTFSLDKVYPVQQSSSEQSEGSYSDSFKDGLNNTLINET